MEPCVRGQVRWVQVQRISASRSQGLVMEACHAGQHNNQAAFPRMSHPHAHATSVMPSSQRRPLQEYLERSAAAAILCCIAQVRLVVRPGKLLERSSRINLKRGQQTVTE